MFPTFIRFPLPRRCADDSAANAEAPQPYRSRSVAYRAGSRNDRWVNSNRMLWGFWVGKLHWSNPTTSNNWLVVWNMNFMTFHILGMSSSQLTNSYFWEGLKPPTRVEWWIRLDIFGQIFQSWSACCMLSMLSISCCRAKHWKPGNKNESPHSYPITIYIHLLSLMDNYNGMVYGCLW